MRRRFGPARVRARKAFAFQLFAVLVAGLWAAPAHATRVYSGFDVEFALPGFGDLSDPGYRDPIMPGVAFTRAATMGLYNAEAEGVYSRLAPGDTEWAYAALNPGEAIRADNYAALRFAPWVDAIEQNPLEVLGLPAVVRVISADVYFELMMLEWGGPDDGGSFRYVRSAVPEPGTALLVAWGACAFAVRRHRGDAS